MYSLLINQQHTLFYPNIHNSKNKFRRYPSDKDLDSSFRHPDESDLDYNICTVYLNLSVYNHSIDSIPFLSFFFFERSRKKIIKKRREKTRKMPYQDDKIDKNRNTSKRKEKTREDQQKPTR